MGAGTGGDPVTATWDLSVWRQRGDPLAGPARGSEAGPLSGLRVAVKDLFAVAGHRTGAGNPQWLAGAVPAPADATAVALLRAAGAEIRGIAQTDELAYSLSGVNAHYGAPPNPAAPALVTGGSSNGPAAAVALGEAEIGLGTDTAGSIRVPAGSCGLFGLRPTHGAVPTGGVIGLSPGFDTVGWITRDARTLQAVGDILLPQGDRTGPTRLLVPLAIYDGVEAAEEVRVAATYAAAAWGVPLEPTTEWPAGLDERVRAFVTVQAAQAWRQHGAWIEAHPGALSPSTEARFRFGAEMTAEQEADAQGLLDAWRAEAAEVLSGGTWLALPAAGGPAHARTSDAATKRVWRRSTLRSNALASACGLPSLVLPARRAAPPLGLALVAAAGSDAALLEAAVAGPQLS
jgi:Asp-tRNA(Asn)/Glu-tRNA(Gln) amidotransferase A subunit family amidase